MRSLVCSTRLGAALDLIGAACMLVSCFLLFSPDLSSVLPKLATPLLLVPLVTLFVLSSSIFAWFRRLPSWLVVLRLVFICVGFSFLVISFLGALVMRCFDVCGPLTLPTADWFFLGGLLLSGLGAFISLRRPGPGETVTP